MKITFWSDFACPWCWIGETNLEAALKSLGRTAEFEMKAYELAPNAPRMGGETTFPRLLARGLSWEEAEGRIKEGGRGRGCGRPALCLRRRDSVKHLRRPPGEKVR